MEPFDIPEIRLPVEKEFPMPEVPLGLKPEWDRILHKVEREYPLNSKRLLQRAEDANVDPVEMQKMIAYERIAREHATQGIIYQVDNLNI